MNERTSRNFQHAEACCGAFFKYCKKNDVHRFPNLRTLMVGHKFDVSIRSLKTFP